jgi:hypothetical protein
MARFSYLRRRKESPVRRDSARRSSEITAGRIGIRKRRTNGRARSGVETAKPGAVF